MGKLIKVLVLTALILANCQPTKPVKIGFVGGLTGRTSQLGILARNGVELAIDEANEQGGVKGRLLELLVRDDRNERDTAIKVDKELINEGVLAIIGHITSSMAEPALAAIEEEDILMVSPSMGTTMLSDLDDNLIRVVNPGSISQGIIIAEKILRDEISEVAVIYDSSNIPYTTEVYHGFVEHYTELGGSVVEVFVIENPENLRTYGRKLATESTEGLLIISSAIGRTVVISRSSAVPIMDVMASHTVAAVS